VLQNVRILTALFNIYRISFVLEIEM
jgi:hypothetical protein